MRFGKLLFGTGALLAAPAAACSLDGMEGHRFSSIMSDYRGGTDSASDSSWQAADGWGASTQGVSGESDQATNQPYDVAQGDPTTR